MSAEIGDGLIVDIIAQGGILEEAHLRLAPRHDVHHVARVHGLTPIGEEHLLCRVVR